MASLPGLPPLPKSLSGISIFDETENFTGYSSSSYSDHGSQGRSIPSSPGYRSNGRSSSLRGSDRSLPITNAQAQSGGHKNEHHHHHHHHKHRSRKVTGLDAHIAVLRKEMYCLRQQDLSLLSQLWNLNESIQDFKQFLQEQEDCIMSPPSPSSADDGDEFYSPIRFHPSPVLPLSAVPEQYRLTSSSSQSSIEYGDV